MLEGSKTDKQEIAKSVLHCWSTHINSKEFCSNSHYFFQIAQCKSLWGFVRGPWKPVYSLESLTEVSETSESLSEPSEGLCEAFENLYGAYESLSKPEIAYLWPISLYEV